VTADTSATIINRGGAGTALTLYHIEEELRALIDTEPMVEGGDQRLAILDEIGQRTEQAIAKRDNLIRLLRHLEMSVYAADDEIKRVKALKEYWEVAKERIERYVVSVIERFAPEPKRGPKKLEGSLGVLSLRKNPDHVEVRDMDALPLEYQEVTVTMPASVWEALLAVMPKENMGKPSFSACKDAIKRDIQAGESVPGAELVFGKNRLGVR